MQAHPQSRTLKAFSTCALTSLLLAGCAATVGDAPVATPPPGDDSQVAYWRQVGANAMAAARRDVPPPPAKNVILFIGDGMGVSTVTAARILAGQLQGQPGEEHVLSFERFPRVALSKTYNTNQQTSDSAGTMTAMITGVKSLAGVLSVSGGVTRGDCASGLLHQVPSLLEEAEHAGLATGIISTARITHATPGATYAHVPERDWEADVDLPAGARAAGCRDIAAQLVEFEHGDGIEVMLGGGRSNFLPVSNQDIEYPQRTGRRTDGRDLVQEWRAAHPDGAWVWNDAGFAALTGDEPSILGLFEPSHMQFDVDRPRDPGGEPSLAAMTELAIRRLSADDDGYFLMVEGGRIDHGHHASNAYRALTDAVAFDAAVAAAVEMTSAADTLIIVTADHSHTMTIAGYPTRGNPILGKVVGNDASGAPEPAPTLDAFGRPFTTLGYANGAGHHAGTDAQPPGAKTLPHFYREAEPWAEGRADLSDVDTTAPLYLQESMIPMPTETHGGEDVAIYARGPGAGLLSGVVEQNVIYYVMREALAGALGRPDTP